jgi:hypothetical protein
MTHVFRHPKFYRIPRDKEEARAQLKVPSSNSDQAISNNDGLAQPVSVRPDPGHKQQTSSNKQQAGEAQASSYKRSSHK